MIPPLDPMERACPVCGLGWGFHDHALHAERVTVPEKLIIRKD